MSRRLLALAAVLAATAALCVPAASASRYHRARDLRRRPDPLRQSRHRLPDAQAAALAAPAHQPPVGRPERRRASGGRHGRPTRRIRPTTGRSTTGRSTTPSSTGIKVVFAIIGTPPWANSNKGLNVAPTNPLDLQRFAAAAATRYSGTYEAPDGRILPPVLRWLAWNEPNNPAFLRPQYKKVNGKQVIQSAIDYAKICNAIVKGIRVTRVGAAKVACGVTGPRGNNNPNTSRPSVAPLPFLRAMKKRAGGERLHRLRAPPVLRQALARRRRRRRRKARAASRPPRSPSGTSTRSSPR